MPASLPLMSQSGMPPPASATLWMGPVRQYPLVNVDCQMSSIWLASRPISRGAIHCSTIAMTEPVGLCSCAEPIPYSPGWSVSTLTKTQLPPARVRIVLIPVILVIEHTSQAAAFSQLGDNRRQREERCDGGQARAAERGHIRLADADVGPARPEAPGVAARDPPAPGRAAARRLPGRLDERPPR